MDFKEAHKKLQIIADGKYNVIKYEVSSCLGGKKAALSQNCGLYIDGLDWYFESTWEDAFESIVNQKGSDFVEEVPSIPEL